MTSSSPTTFLRALRDLDLPDHPEAVVVDGRALSRAGLRAVAVAFGARLPDAGPVAVCAEPTLETVVAQYPGSDAARTAQDRLQSIRLGKQIR